ncbi:hypothetical protein HOB10_00565 [Candidatus Parcubacteria bacterium]|nr:hypothetical protein [Candidatus Parcubacteria bacterium]
MKTNLIRIAILFAVIFTTTFAFAGNTEVTLTDEMQAQLDELILAKNFAEADTLQMQFEAQLRSDQRNSKRIEEARARTEKRWHAEVSPDSMTYDKVWQWADNDSTKATWLGKRYNVEFDENLDTTGMIDALKSTINQRQADRVVNDKINSAVARSEAKTNKRITDLENQIEPIKRAVNQLGYDMGASFSYAACIKHVDDEVRQENLDKIAELRKAFREQTDPILEESTKNNDKTDNE